MGSIERKEREKEARKKHILKAARTLLLKKGLHATTVEQVARLAELSVGTIYLYYRGKEDIFAALQVEGLELLDGLAAAAVGGDGRPSEKITALAAAYVRFSVKHKNYYDIINYFLSSPQQLLRGRFKGRVDRIGGGILNYCVEAIEAGIRSGEFRKVDPRKHAIWLWGSLHGLIHFGKLEKTILRPDNYRELVEYAVSEFIEGLERVRG